MSSRLVFVIVFVTEGFIHKIILQINFYLLFVSPIRSKS